MGGLFRESGGSQSVEDWRFHGTHYREVYCDNLLRNTKPDEASDVSVEVKLYTRAW